MEEQNKSRPIAAPIDLAARLALLESKEARRSGRAKRIAWVSATGLLLASSLAVSEVRSQACAAGLACFQSGQPARASEVNGNFLALTERLANTEANLSQRVASLEGQLGSLTIESKHGAQYFVVGDLVVAWGNRQVSGSGAIATDFDVVLPIQFASVPVVVVTPSDPGYGFATDKTGLGTHSITSNTFKIMFKHEGTLPFDFAIRWIAIGKAP